MPELTGRDALKAAASGPIELPAEFKKLEEIEEVKNEEKKAEEVAAEANLIN